MARARSCAVALLLGLAAGAAADTCAAFCGSNNQCTQKHYCGSGCSADADCDASGEAGSCARCDVGDRTCRPPRPASLCNYTSKADTQVLEDYKSFNTLPDAASCQAECCKDDVCSAVTWIKASWGTLCYLHNHTTKQAPNNGTTVFTRTNAPYPSFDNTKCPRCDLFNGQCSAGFGCGCPCAVDTDCDNHNNDTACTRCVGAVGTTQLGMCGGGPAAAAEQCIAPYPGEPHKNCSSLMDVVFLLDGSGSIAASDWVLIKRFTMEIGLNFSSAPVLMNYAIVQFGSGAETFLNLTGGNSSFQLVMNTIPQFESSTNTGAGLQMVGDQFKVHGRAGAYRVVVLITDGMWNEGPDPIAISKQLMTDGAHIYTIAVGNAQTENVKKLTSTPLSHFYFNVTSEGQLPVILHQVIDNMCVRDI